LNPIDEQREMDELIKVLGSGHITVRNIKTLCSAVSALNKKVSASDKCSQNYKDHVSAIEKLVDKVNDLVKKTKEVECQNRIVDDLQWFLVNVYPFPIYGELRKTKRKTLKRKRNKTSH
jgi:hypothetical protein